MNDIHTLHPADYSLKARMAALESDVDAETLLSQAAAVCTLIQTTEMPVEGVIRDAAGVIYRNIEQVLELIAAGAEHPRSDTR